MNLIDKDSVVATIKKHLEEERHSYFCKCLLSEIDSLNVEEQPSLPSGLDEAAEEYADYNSRRWHEDGDVYYDHSKILEAFKAGAKWMAQQYKTLGETEIYLEDDGSEAPYTQEWLDLATTEFAVPEGFKPGDKVIVQIRKK